MEKQQSHSFLVHEVVAKLDYWDVLPLHLSLHVDKILKLLYNVKLNLRVKKK